MNEVTTDNDLSMWFSTYGLLTAKRILEGFKIYLDNEELTAAFKNPGSVYYLLLRVPLKNVFNGIILQQAHDYQIYAQKLFIDYLLSGEGNKDAESPGANTREDLEALRNKLMEIGANFNKDEEIHQRLIFDSQASLIKLSDELKKIMQVGSNNAAQLLANQQIIKDEKLIARAIRTGVIHYEKIENESLFWEGISKVLDTELTDEIRPKLLEVIRSLDQRKNELDELLSHYLEKISDMFVNLRGYRSQFYNLILRANELIQLLPDYRVDREKDDENRASLHFDSHIGGD